MCSPALDSGLAPFRLVLEDVHLDNFTDISVLPRTLGLTDDTEDGRERRDLIIASTGTRLIGVFANKAAGVTEWREPTPLPRAPTAVLGVVCVRGRMLTVLDTLALIGERVANERSSPGWLIALNGDEQLALAVDRTERIVEVFIDEIEPVEHGVTIVRGILQTGKDLIAVLNLQELFAAAMDGSERRRVRT